MVHFQHAMFDDTRGYPVSCFSEFLRGQAEEKRAEAEMEELEKHRVAWPEIWREMGVSKVMRVPSGEHTKNHGKIQHVEWVNQVFLF